MFTRADKGNITVAVNREDYIGGVELLLNDKNTYLTVKENRVKKIERSLNTMIKNWELKRYISNTTAQRLKSYDSYIPRAYGLRKIHKAGYLYRLIVSSVGSPLHKFCYILA